MSTPNEHQGDFGIYIETQDIDALTTCGAHQETGRCNHEYPTFHRIADIIRGDRAIRVSRCTACGERIFVKEIPIDVADATIPGVPYNLKGSALKSWIADEIQEPSKGPINWDLYFEHPNECEAN